VRREQRQVVELLLRLRVENLIAPERVEPLGLILRQWCWSHTPPPTTRFSAGDHIAAERAGGWLTGVRLTRRGGSGWRVNGRNGMGVPSGEDEGGPKSGVEHDQEGDCPPRPPLPGPARRHGHSPLSLDGPNTLRDYGRGRR
jgi:hypothetical protein